MVQRKVSARLGHQPDHVKMQHQDVKGRAGAADLMKKQMKKSASVKRPEAEDVRPTWHVKEKNPGEPPPPRWSTAISDAVTPQKQSPASSLATTPNYMKSTSSSDARKEKSRVSIEIPNIGIPDCSNFSGYGSKSPGSGNKATKTLARTCSLKSFKIATKNSGFKIARASVKKCFPDVLCENLDAQKATCSSTLKHYKFPVHLELNPGGTEVEGTSAIKVCPYNYCSLNGHHHDPLPPLKCFLSARRLAVKAQRGMRLGCRSPRRVKPNGSGPNYGEKIVAEDTVENPRICTQGEEEHRDFFVEIFCKNQEETGVDRKGIYSQVVDPLSSVHGSSETTAEKGEEQVLSAAPDALDQNGESNLVQEEKELLDEADSDASDVEQETGYGSVLYIDYYREYSPDAVTGTEAKSDGCPGELREDEVSQESFDEEGSNADAFSCSDDSESSCSYDYLQSFYNMETSAHVEVPEEKPEPTAAHVEVPEEKPEPPHVEVPEEKPEPASSDGENPTLSVCGEATGLPIGSEVAGYQIIAEDETSSKKCEYLQDYEEANTETGEEGKCDTTTDYVMSEQISSVEGGAFSSEDFRTSSLEDPEKESDPTEAASDVNDKVETEDTSSNAGTEYQGNSTEDFLTSILVDPEKVSDFMALLRTTEVEHDTADEVEAEDAASAETGNQEEDFITSNPVAQEKESDFMAALLQSTEKKHNLPNKFKAADASKSDIEDYGLALYIAKCNKSIEDGEESRPFNPRGPNFLPVEPDPEAEKVDLRHQELDERKNTEEYLVDYALRQAVTKLGPARKKKVALLVEAFEKVMPVTKWELHSTPGPTFNLTRPIQACQ